MWTAHLNITILRKGVGSPGGSARGSCSFSTWAGSPGYGISPSQELGSCQSPVGKGHDRDPLAWDKYVLPNWELPQCPGQKQQNAEPEYVEPEGGRWIDRVLQPSC